MKLLRPLALVASLLLAACSQAEPITRPMTAQEFTGLGQWLNSPPLTLQQLRGKVVLVDFWTYTCINCIHTLPYVKRWHERYKDQGLTVVGVHTPEFPEEKSLENLKDATRRLDIHYPVVQDNQYATWEVYGNRFWPAFYLINRKGEVVYRHYGEGRYDETEATIRKLLAEKA